MFRHVTTSHLLLLLCMLSIHAAAAQSDFRVAPYVQNPDFSSASVIWFTESDTPGTVTVSDETGVVESRTSSPVQATALAYPTWEVDTNPAAFPGGVAPSPPYKHRVRFSDLEWSRNYTYVVSQGAETFASSFHTAPGILRPVRFAVYGDSETEPESDGARVEWSDPTGQDPDRTYLIDQTHGYSNNLQILRNRDLDFVMIAGDLVQSGDEQRDWDRFWEHLTSLAADSSLAASVPVYAVPGNHEYYASPHAGQGEAPKSYRQPYSEEAMARYRTYFEAPSNGTNDDREGRYYRFDYGPVTVIAVDVCNNGQNQSSQDTNFQLLGEDDPDGGPAPSFTPGSPQYVWLEEQLADAQQVSPFTFVLIHYTPYSVGPHGWPPGEASGQNDLSGVPVRELTPLFEEYGVDAVFAGHDEMWERSVVAGTEKRPGGGERPHEIQIYDVGTGGDGLRGPEDGLENPYQRFLAHTGSPEVWNGPQLVQGGKHYGHLEVSVERTGEHTWVATLTPVYAFPLFDETGTAYLGFERRVYDDVVTLVSDDAPSILATDDVLPGRLEPRISDAYPNPASGAASVQLVLTASTDVAMTAYDLLGRPVRTLSRGLLAPGSHVVAWDGSTDQGDRVPPGLYVLRIAANGRVVSRTVVIM